MNRLKILLMCFCMVLAVTLPAAGISSGDANQNSTVSDEVTVQDINQEVKECSQELNKEVKEEPSIVPEPEPELEPEITKCPGIKEESEIQAESEIIEETDTCSEKEEIIAPEENKCPVIAKEPEPENVCPISTEEKEECPVIDEPEKTCPKPVTEPSCSIKPAVSDSKCSKAQVPVSTGSTPKPEKVCPIKTEPKPACSKLITPIPKPSVIIPKGPESPVIPDDSSVPVIESDKPTPGPNTSSVTPNEPDNSVKITTIKLCKDNICTVGAAGNVLSIINYSNAKDPTYAELIAFLKSDKTDEIPYTSTFQCGDFAVLLHNNAEKNGIRAGWNGVNSCNHAFNIFNTTDRGLVYIDCTGVPGGSTYQDKQLNCEVGKPLTGTYLFRNGTASDMGCTVESLLTFW